MAAFIVNIAIHGRRSFKEGILRMWEDYRLPTSRDNYASQQFNFADTSEFHFFVIKFQHPKISNYNNSYLIIHERYTVVRPLFLINFTRHF
jgi:hypothetical protein